MDAGFVLSYIIVPVIILGFLVRKERLEKRKKSENSLGKFLLFRGVFYFYLALATAFNYLKYEKAMRAVVGYTIALAILEGGYNIWDGIGKTKEYYEKHSKN